MYELEKLTNVANSLSTVVDVGTKVFATPSTQRAKIEAQKEWILAEIKSDTVKYCVLLDQIGKIATSGAEGSQIIALELIKKL